jgi:hypothetical protein
MEEIWLENKKDVRQAAKKEWKTDSDATCIANILMPRRPASPDTPEQAEYQFLS